MKIYDVVIIGAGVVGAAIARELSHYKLDIAVLEKEQECAFGVSKSNSGIIHPGTQNSHRSLKGRLCVEGNFLVRKIARQLGVDFKQVGELIIAFSEEEVSRLLELKKEAGLLGVPGVKIVDRAWLKKNEPNLSEKALKALYAPTAGIISPYRLVYDLCESAVKNGVELYTSQRVKSIRKKPQEYFEVGTQNNIFKARYVVNAAGLFADEVSKMAGIPAFTITPRKGEEFILDKKRGGLARHLLFPLPSKISKGVLIIKTADGNPMIGPTAEDICDKHDLSTTEDGLEAVLAGARKLMPSIRGEDIIAYFAGLRPVAGDDFIIRHEDGLPGFVNVAGIQSPGLTASPAIAVFTAGILKKNGLKLKRKLFFRRRQKELTHLFFIPLHKTKGLVKKDAAYGDIVCRCEMVSAHEIRQAIRRGATTLDGIKFRTRAQAGRCHGCFCTSRIMKILSEELGISITEVTKRGQGSEIVKQDRKDA